jgi:hypothetical protein
VEGVPLTGDDIRTYLLEVGEEVPDTSPQYDIVIVGGALLALLDFRETTNDVDSIDRIPDELATAAATIAQRHGIDIGWLNSRAAGFRPATLRQEDCVMLIEHSQLRVFGAPLQQIFVMKLFAMRQRSEDFDDLVAIWPSCGFASAEEAADLYQDAYPHIELDPFMVNFIQEIERA